MKKTLFTLTLLLCGSQAFAQTYVNEMSEAEVKRDCYIEGAGAVYNDRTDNFLYGDNTFTQKASSTASTSYIFNRDLVGNKNYTGFRINICFRTEDNLEVISKMCKIEYSTDEETYHLVPDMKTEITYKAELGESYWTDVYFQGALPANAVEIKVTLLPYKDLAAWIPCFRRTELFYQGGTAYSYITPPNLWEAPTATEGFEAIFDNFSNLLITKEGSNNASSVTVVDNDFKGGISTTDKVLKISQVPATDEDPWAWGNGDWFGASVAIKDEKDESKGQLTVITEDTKYLHVHMLRNTATTCGLENFGGEQFKTTFAYNSVGEWQDIVVDLSEYIGSEFTALMIQPNNQFQTNDTKVEEITYIGKMFLSSSSEEETTSIISYKTSTFNAWGATGKIIISDTERAMVEVYSLDGVLVQKLTLENSTQDIVVPAGLYIVKTNNSQTKVLVK